MQPPRSEATEVLQNLRNLQQLQGVPMKGTRRGLSRIFAMPPCGLRQVSCTVLLREMSKPPLASEAS